MKKLICLMLAALMALSMAACAGSGEETTAVTEPEVFERPDLDQFAPWVLTAEYEGTGGKLRNYEYNENGELTGFGDYKAVTEENDRGGKTLKLTAYDSEGKVSAQFSKYEYIYDEAGRMVEYKRFEAIGNKLADSFVFTYDADGQLVKQEKFYMELPQETIEYTYEGQQLTKSSYKTSVYDATYTYVLDDAGWPAEIRYTVRYVKTGNVDEGTLVLDAKVEQDAKHYQVTLTAEVGDEDQKATRELLVYEEVIDTAGDVDAVRIVLGDWGSFQMGWVPARALGSLVGANWSGGTGTYIYKPLSVYLTEKAAA